MCWAFDGDIIGIWSYVRELGDQHNADVEKVEDFFANMTKATDAADRDIRTLN